MNRLRASIPSILALLGGCAAWLAPSLARAAEEAHQPGGEANLVLPDLGSVKFLTDAAGNGGQNGHQLLMWGLIVSALGMVFGLVVMNQVKNLPVHKSMREVSELIFETCKTYLIQQGKFLMILEVLIGAIMVWYFSAVQHLSGGRVALIIFASIIGILGSYGVAWFGIRINTYANSRTAFASLKGKAHPVYAIPLKSGMSVGMLLISVELVLMLTILLFVPGDLAGSCFIGFAIGESLGA